MKFVTIELPITNPLPEKFFCFCLFRREKLVNCLLCC